MRRLINDTILSQILQLRDTYYCDIYDVTSMREYSYREGLVELYNLINEHPDKYYQAVCNGSGIDL